MANLQDIIKFDENMVCYYDELPLWSSPFGILLLNNIPFKKNSIIVDIGCGTGFPLLELAQRFGDSCKLFGIDPWVKAIDRANSKMKQYRIKNVVLIKGSGENIPFNNNCVDTITSNLGINNFGNPDKVIQECYRVLKSDGKLIFTTNLFGQFEEFYSVFEEVLKELNLYNEIQKLRIHIAERYTLENINLLVKNHKFSVDKVVKDNYNMKFIDGSTFLNHYFIKLAFLPAWKKLIIEANWNEVFSSLENRLNEIASEKGEFVFNVPIAYIECEKK